MGRKILELRNIKKSYGNNVILDDFNLSVNENEFVTFLGPSGCGKTTVLRIIAGFEAMQGGKLLLDGEEIQKLPSHKRPINTVFQKYALFPNMNIYDNIAFGLRNNIYSNVYDIGTMNLMNKYGYEEEEIDGLMKILSHIEKPIDVKKYVIDYFKKQSTYFAFEEELKNLKKQYKNSKYKDFKEQIAEMFAKNGVNPVPSFGDEESFKDVENEILAKASENDNGYLIYCAINDRKFKENVIHDEVMKALRFVNLEGYENREITSLSGGQMQRIAIARAIVNKPRILLLDEPLSALDLKLRKSMRLELREMQRKLGITFIFVTHDQEEAMVMSDTVVVMNNGKIQQMGRPEDIYNAPINRFVATFIGEANLLRGVYSEPRRLQMMGKTFKVSAPDYGLNEELYCIVEKDDFDIRLPEFAPLTGKIKTVSFEENKYTLGVMVGETLIKVESDDKYKVGDIIGLSVDPSNVYCESIKENKAKLLANYEGANIMKGVYLGNQKVSFLGATFRSYQPTFFPGEVVDVVIRPEDFDLVLGDPDKAIIQGIVTKTAFTGMTFNMWVNCNGTVLMVTDYQNAEVGERIGLSVDFYEIHMMKVADEDQPLEIRKIREEGRRLALEQEDK